MPWVLANWKMILGGLIIAASFTAGWVIKGAFDDSEALAIEKARVAMIDQLREDEAHIANILERKLSELRANEKTIERERLKIIDRPVYSNECLDADGVRLVDKARTSKTDPGKSTGTVSGTN